MEALGALLAIVVALALLILPILTFIFVLNVRSEQREQRQLMDLLLLRSESRPAAAEPPPASAPEPEATPEPQPVITPVVEPAPAVVMEAPTRAEPPPIPVMMEAPKETTAPFPSEAAASAHVWRGIPPPVPEFDQAPPPPPPPPPAAPQTEAPGKVEQILQRIWNWIVIGEEYRTPGMSWEFAVATNWLLRLGIVIAVIGVGFFLKYSIEHGWIGPTARVAMSVVTGVVMLAGGARLLQKPYHLLGQGLIGGGLAVLYFSMFAAFNFYHLIGMVVAFALMAVVTLTAGVLAVRFNSLLIAILGILGGYGTPLMLSTGTVNFPGLFGYLLLLGLGILGISRLRAWPLLNYLGMVLTYFLALGAVAKHYTAADFAVVLAFLAGFYLLYAAVMVWRNLVEREQITVLELLGSLANTLMFFGLAYHVVTHDHAAKYAALLTLALAALHIALAYWMLVRRQNDRGLLCLFLALASLFLALTPPLAFTKEWITASWALQGLVMLWLGGKLNSQFLRLLACAAYLLAVMRLMGLDFYRQFSGSLAPTTTWLDYLKILGERLFEMGVPIAAIGGAWKLLRLPPAKGGLAVERAGDVADEAWQPAAAAVAATMGVVVLFIYAQFELYHTFHFFHPPLAVPAMTFAWFGLGLFLLSLVLRGCGFWAYALLAIASIGAVCKLMTVDLLGWDLNATTWIYGATYAAGPVLIRLMDFVLCLGLLGVVYAYLRGHEVGKPIGLTAGYGGLALLLMYLTLETSTALAHFAPTARAGGITVLWAAYALALLLVGLARALRSLRYIGLAIFGVVVFKVFFVDLAHLDAFYRIIAFIVLGLILLGAALIYLKFRQRFQSEPPKGDQP